jgi:hypothetical protein
MTEKINLLPAELDNENVLFSYGSLLNHETLRKLFKARGEFQIFETNGVAEAANLAENNPQDIIILKNVRLENVRVTIITETMLRRWYKNSGGELQTLIDAQVTTPEIPQALFLYARAAAPHEKGKTLNGGLICNLNGDETRLLDKYEFAPVLTRERTPKLKISGQIYLPRHITFYAGNVSPDDITAEEKAERSKFLNLNRKRGRQSPQAKWHRQVRRVF